MPFGLALLGDLGGKVYDGLEKSIFARNMIQDQIGNNKLQEDT